MLVWKSLSWEAEKLKLWFSSWHMRKQMKAEMTGKWQAAPQYFTEGASSCGVQFSPFSAHGDRGKKHWCAPMMTIYDSTNMCYHHTSPWSNNIRPIYNGQYGVICIPPMYQYDDPLLSNTGWWFGTVFIFHILEIIIPADRLIFFRRVETTNENMCHHDPQMFPVPKACGLDTSPIGDQAAVASFMSVCNIGMTTYTRTT